MLKCYCTILNIGTCFWSKGADPDQTASDTDKKGNMTNLGIIAIFLHKNIFCDPSLEPSLRDGSNEG